jgi:predicted acylesterase/phospholipase RssA
MSYGVVFSGGGALGAWEVGCYDRILQHHKNEKPVIVTGASAGAINAAGVKAGMNPQQLADLWGGITREKVYTSLFSARDSISIAWKAITGRSLTAAVIDYLTNVRVNRRSFFNTDPLRETLTDILNPYWNTFQIGEMQLAISLTNLTHNRKEIFYKLPSDKKLPDDASDDNARWNDLTNLEDLVSSLVGSAAIPIIFPPHKGYFDGGVLLNQPISPALRLIEPDILYVLIPSPFGMGDTENMLAIGSTLVSAWLATSLVAQIEQVKLLNKVKQMLRKPKIRLCVIRSSFDLTRKTENPADIGNFSLLGFGDRVSKLVQAGKDAATLRLDHFTDNENTWY